MIPIDQILVQWLGAGRLYRARYSHVGNCSVCRRHTVVLAMQFEFGLASSVCAFCAWYFAVKEGRIRIAR